MIRSSTPSKRGQRMTSPGPAAHSRAFAWPKGLPRGTHDEARSRIVRSERRVEARGDDVGPHHHAGPPAGRRVVDCSMPPEPVLADVARLERPQAPRARFARQRMAERPGEHGGKESQDGGAKHSSERIARRGLYCHWLGQGAARLRRSPRWNRGAEASSPSNCGKFSFFAVLRRMNPLCAPCRRVSLVEEGSTRISVDGSGS